MYAEEDIDGPKDVYDPITGELIAKKTTRKRKGNDRQYLALADLRRGDGIKRVATYSNRVPQPQPQSNGNPMLRGRTTLAPLPGGGGSSDLPSNLTNYVHPQENMTQNEGYYNINDNSQDDIYQQIKQILFSMTNSNHLSNVGIVGARHPATNDMGQKVDLLVGGQRPDSNELLTAGVDLHIDDGESRYQILNDTMKKIFSGFTDISGIQPEEITSASNEGLSPFTDQGLTANVVPSGQNMIHAWTKGRSKTVGKQRYKPISLVYIKGTHFGRGSNKVNPAILTHFIQDGHMSGKNTTSKYRLLKTVPLQHNFLDSIGNALGKAVSTVTDVISTGVNDVLSVGNFVGQIAQVI